MHKLSTSTLVEDLTFEILSGISAIWVLVDSGNKKLDEPLSAVDEETRGEMYELLRRVQRDTGVTVLHVTHNPDEARELADVVFNMRDGKIQKEGA